MRFSFIDFKDILIVEVQWESEDQYSEQVPDFRVREENDGSWTALVSEVRDDDEPLEFEPYTGFRTKKAAAEYVTFEIHDNDYDTVWLR